MMKTSLMSPWPAVKVASLKFTDGFLPLAVLSCVEEDKEAPAPPDLHERGDIKDP